MRRPQIAVIGNNAGPPALLESARQLGTALVDQGWRIVCGGRGGVMEAVAEGAQASERATGADVVGLLPTSRAADANPHVDIVIPTGLGIARNALVAHAADVVVALAGGSGTLSELAFAWQLGKPIIAFETHDGWAQELAGQRLDARRADTIVGVSSVAEAVAAVRKALNGAAASAPD
jgi:uncharacterized protein (TIGR00725 family)